MSRMTHFGSFEKCRVAWVEHKHVYFIIGLIVKRTTPSLNDPSTRASAWFHSLFLRLSHIIHSNVVLTFYAATKLCDQSLWHQFDCIIATGRLFLSQVCGEWVFFTLQSLCNILIGSSKPLYSCTLFLRRRFLKSGPCKVHLREALQNSNNGFRPLKGGEYHPNRPT